MEEVAVLEAGERKDRSVGPQEAAPGDHDRCPAAAMQRQRVAEVPGIEQVVRVEERHAGAAVAQRQLGPDVARRVAAVVITVRQIKPDEPRACGQFAPRVVADEVVPHRPFHLLRPHAVEAALQHLGRFVEAGRDDRKKGRGHVQRSGPCLNGERSASSST